MTVDRTRTGRLSFLALCALVAWAAWPLGSNRPWSLALMEMWVMALLGVVLMRAALARAHNRVRLAPLARGVAWCLVLWVGLAALQLLQLPDAMLAAVKPLAWEIHRWSPAFDGSAPLTVDYGSSVEIITKYIAYATACVLTAMLATSRRRLIVLACVLLAVCTAQSLYALAVTFDSGNRLWNPAFAPDFAAGTYVGRNHFAGLLVLGLGIAAGFAFMRGSAGAGSWLRARTEQMLAFVMGRGLWLLFALTCMLAALIESGSRGAVAALLAAAVVVSLSQRRARRGMRPIVFLTLAGAIAVAGFGATAMGERALGLGFESNRLELAGATLQLIAQSPWLGGGAGTFEWRFPMVHSPEFGQIYYQHAHNDPLEMVADLGIVGTLPLAVAIGLALFAAYRGLRLRHDPVARALCAGAAIGGTGFLLHGLVDFNFQIPANGLYFFVLLGLGINAADRVLCRAAAVGRSDARYGSDDEPPPHAPRAGVERLEDYRTSGTRAEIDGA